MPSGQVHVTSVSPLDHSTSSSLSRFKDGNQKGRGVAQWSEIPGPGPAKACLLLHQHTTVSLGLVSIIPGWPSGDGQKLTCCPIVCRLTGDTGPIYLAACQRTGFKGTNQRQGTLDFVVIYLLLYPLAMIPLPPVGTRSHVSPMTTLLQRDISLHTEEGE